MASTTLASVGPEVVGSPVAEGLTQVAWRPGSARTGRIAGSSQSAASRPRRKAQAIPSRPSPGRLGVERGRGDRRESGQQSPGRSAIPGLDRVEDARGRPRPACGPPRRSRRVPAGLGPVEDRGHGGAGFQGQEHRPDRRSGRPGVVRGPRRRPMASSPLSRALRERRPGRPSERRPGGSRRSTDPVRPPRLRGTRSRSTSPQLDGFGIPSPGVAEQDRVRDKRGRSPRPDPWRARLLRATSSGSLGRTHSSAKS